MVIWHGVLKTAPGKRNEYIEAIQKANLVDLFTKQPGNVFYTIGASIQDKDTLIVCDAWTNKETFTAHDTSKEVDVWREIYAKYVVDCTSNLYEC